MKIKEVLKPFKENFEHFLEYFGEEEQGAEGECNENEIYILIEDMYYLVDMEHSYWYHEDDGTIVFRVNDIL